MHPRFKKSTRHRSTHTRRKKNITLYALFIAQGLFSTICNAISIDPLSVVLSMHSASVTQGVLTVHNETPNPMNTLVKVLDESSDPSSDAAWLDLSFQKVHLDAGQTTQLFYRISIPPDGAGQFIARLSFIEESPDFENSSDTSTLSINYKISMYIVATIEGTEVYDAKIHHLTWPARVDQKKQILLENTGNVALKPEGTSTVIDTNTGQAVGSPIKMNNPYHIFPRKKALLELFVKEDFEPGNYEARIEIPTKKEGHTISKMIELIIPPSSTGADSAAPSIF